MAHAGIHVYSSRDLCNRNDEGIALVLSDDLQSLITRGCILERPQVIFNSRTKKLVAAWLHLEPKDKGYAGALIGVAMTPSVEGSSMRNPNSLRPITGELFLGCHIQWRYFSGRAAGGMHRNSWREMEPIVLLSTLPLQICRHTGGRRE